MWAWLVPLISFVFILLFGKYLGPHGKGAGYVATLAIVTSGILSFIALFGVWLPYHDMPAKVHHEEHHDTEDHHVQRGHVQSRHVPSNSESDSLFQQVSLFSEKDPSLDNESAIYYEARSSLNLLNTQI